MEQSDPASIGRYRLAARLGSGGMGTVYLGRTPGGRPAAIKVVKSGIQDQPGALSRFQREVETLRTVRNPFTAALIDFEVTQPPFWMATEYVPGPTLAEAVKQHGPLEPDLLRGLFAALAEGLEDVHAHRVLHRDIKPANIILSVTGPQLIDFGIARTEDQPGLTELGMTIGTPGYLAPEVIIDQQLGPAADIFALGATMAYAGTGRPPYGKGSVHTINTRCIEGAIDLEGLPQDIAELVEDCVSRDLSRRPLPEQIVERCRARTALLEHVGYQRIISGSGAQERRPEPASDQEPELETVQVGSVPNVPATVLAGKPLSRKRSRITLAIAAAAALALTAGAVAVYGLDRQPDKNPTTQPTASSSPSPEPENATLTVPGGGCLSVPETLASGDIPTVQVCDGSPAQQWEFTPTGEIKALERCLDVAPGERGNGTGVQLWDCNGTEAQVFARHGNQTQHLSSGRCLTTEANEAEPGAQVFLWDCSGDNLNQEFPLPGL
nr:serine/threonine protein kinase [Kineosporia babensis]